MVFLSDIRPIRTIPIDLYSALHTNWDPGISWCRGEKVRDRVRRMSLYKDHRPPAFVQLLPFRLAYGRPVNWKLLLLYIIAILLYYYTNVTRPRPWAHQQHPLKRISRLSTAVWRPVLKRLHASRTAADYRPRKCPTWHFRITVKPI